MQITPVIVDERNSSKRRPARLRSRVSAALAATAVGTAAVAGGALAATAGAHMPPSHMPSPHASGNYSFRTLNDQKDPTFNQLLGINNANAIAGYFGSGEAGHPNKGYVLFPNYSQNRYRDENFPGSAQTQVTGLNNRGITVGFWVDQNGAANGFYAIHRHHFRTVNFPTQNNASPQVDQLLGVNDSRVAVGFYTDNQGVNHGYTYNIRRHRFHSINVPGDTNVTAAAINDRGDIAGFADNAAGTTESFLLRSDGRVLRLNVPGASSTQALGVNGHDEVVGQYTVGTGDSAMTHGFVWTPERGFRTVDDPNGVGATTINGVNDRGDLVGFYTDAAGNTDGLLAKPQR